MSIFDELPADAFGEAPAPATTTPPKSAFDALPADAFGEPAGVQQSAITAPTGLTQPAAPVQGVGPRPNPLAGSGMGLSLPAPSVVDEMAAAKPYTERVPAQQRMEASAIRGDMQARGEDPSVLIPQRDDPQTFQLAGVDKTEFYDALAQAAGTSRGYYEFEQANKRDGTPIPEQFRAPREKARALSGKVADAYLKRLADYASYQVNTGQPLNSGYVAQQVANNVGDYVPFSPTGLAKMAELNAIAQKAEAGSELTQGEQDRMRLFSAELKADKTFAGGALDMAYKSFPYAAEFVATGGLGGAARAATKKTLTAAVEKAGLQTVVKSLEKTAATRIPAKMAERVLLDMGEGAARAAADPAGLGEETLRRMMPGFDMQRDGEDFRAVMQTEKPGDGFLDALGKAALNNTFENMGELFGSSVIEPAMQKIGKNAAKVEIVKKWMASVPGRTLKDARKFLEKTGWNGMVGEIAEEYYTSALQGGFGTQGDGAGFDNAVAQVLDTVANTPQMFVSFLPMQAMGVAGATQNNRQRAQRRDALQADRANLQEARTARDHAAVMMAERGFPLDLIDRMKSAKTAQQMAGAFDAMREHVAWQQGEQSDLAAAMLDAAEELDANVAAVDSEGKATFGRIGTSPGGGTKAAKDYEAEQASAAELDRASARDVQLQTRSVPTATPGQAAKPTKAPKPTRTLKDFGGLDPEAMGLKPEEPAAPMPSEDEARQTPNYMEYRRSGLSDADAVRAAQGDLVDRKEPVGVQFPATAEDIFGKPASIEEQGRMAKRDAQAGKPLTFEQAPADPVQGTQEYRELRRAGLSHLDAVAQIRKENDNAEVQMQGQGQGRQTLLKPGPQADEGTGQGQVAERSPSAGGPVTEPSGIDPEAVTQAAHEAATSPRNDLPEPTEAQREAGNYQKGHVTLHGLDVAIENPAGSRRRPDWPELKDHYGYIKRSAGKDGDQVDVFVNPARPESGKVFVVDQVDPDTGEFDEHKAIFGAESMDEARRIYLRNYEPGWQGEGGITEMSPETFKKWVRSDAPRKNRKPKQAKASTAKIEPVPTPEPRGLVVPDDAGASAPEDDRFAGMPANHVIVWARKSGTYDYYPMMQPYDGTREDALRVFKQLDTLRKDSDLVMEMIGATGEAGKGKFAIPVNARSVVDVHDVDSADGRYTLGDLNAYSRERAEKAREAQARGDFAAADAQFVDEISAKVKYVERPESTDKHTAAEHIREAKALRAARYPVAAVDDRYNKWNEFLSSRKRSAEHNHAAHLKDIGEARVLLDAIRSPDTRAAQTARLDGLEARVKQQQADLADAVKQDAVLTDVPATAPNGAAVKVRFFASDKPTSEATLVRVYDAGFQHGPRAMIRLGAAATDRGRTLALSNVFLPDGTPVVPGTPEKTAAENAQSAEKPNGAEPADESLIVNPIDRGASQDDKVAALVALSKANAPLVHSMVSEINRRLGSEVAKFGENGFKKPHKIKGKANRPEILKKKPWFNVEHVRDSLRFKAKLNSFDDITTIFDVLLGSGVTIVKADTDKMFTPKEWGWRFVAFDLRMPNGHLVEFYAPLRELDSKEVKGPNHDLFEKWRERDMDAVFKDKALFEEYRADVATSWDRYNAAFTSALQRLGFADENAARASFNSIVERLGSSTGTKSSLSSSVVGTTPGPSNLQTPPDLRATEPKAEGSPAAASPKSQTNTSPVPVASDTTRSEMGSAFISSPLTPAVSPPSATVGNEKAQPDAAMLQRVAGMVREEDPGQTAAGAQNIAGKLLTAIQSGTWTDLLRPDGKASRRVFARMTGIRLPAALGKSKALFVGKGFPIKTESAPASTSPLEQVPPVPSDAEGFATDPEWTKELDAIVRSEPIVNAAKNTPHNLRVEALQQVRSRYGAFGQKTVYAHNDKPKVQRMLRFMADVDRDLGRHLEHWAMQVDDRARQKPDEGAAPAASPAVQPPPVPPAAPAAKARVTVKSATENLAPMERARMAELQAKLRQKLLGQVNVGLDPEILTIGAEMTGLYVKGGVRTFRQYATNVRADMGDVWGRLRRYLHGLWTTAGADNAGLDEPSRTEAEKILTEIEATDSAGAETAGPVESAVEDGNREAATDTGMDGGNRGGGIETPPGGADTVAPAAEPAAGDGTEGAGTGQRGSGGRGGSVQPGRGRSGDGVASPDTAGTRDAGDSVGDGRRGPADERPDAPADVAGPQTDPNATNHRIERGANIAPPGDAGKLRANFAAIRLLRTLEDENRNATPEEKAILAKYVGWGGFKEAFNTARKGEYQWRDRYGETHDTLQKLLSEEEFQSAARSASNAHYTDGFVISAMWYALRRMGFKGGTVLEAGAGVGHFFGLMPNDLHDNSKLLGVELDLVTGKILAKLYPQADVRIQGFEEANIPNNSVDVMAGNVPFAKTGPYDPAHPKLNLHNYFIARGIDKVKPGGLIVVISSNSTMDQNPDQRAYLASRADLVAAIRLPNDAFMGNAKTEVTTDILIFRKPDGAAAVRAEPWANVAEVAPGVMANQYWLAHPENALGKHTTEGTMYRADSYALKSARGQDTKALLEAAIARLPEDIMGRTAAAVYVGNKGGTAGKGQREYEYVETDEQLWQVKGGELEEPEVLRLKVNSKGETTPLTARDREKREKVMRGYMTMRDGLRKLVALETSEEASDKEIEAQRKALNKAYDAYVKDFGTFNNERTQSRQARFLEDDPSYFLVSTVEEPTYKLDEAGERVTEWVKAEIMRRRVNKPLTVPKTAGSVRDALNVSLNWHAKIDLPFMAELTGKTEAQVRAELIKAGEVYDDPQSGNLVLRWKYLSGPVRMKLRAAEEAAKSDPSYQANVDALKAVQPQPRTFTDIVVGMGEHWMPPGVYNAFFTEFFQTPVTATFRPQASAWSLEAENSRSDQIKNTGTQHFDGLTLAQKAMSKSSVDVFKTVYEDRKEKRVRDAAGSAAAQAAQEKIIRAFHEWTKTTQARVQGPSGRDMPVQMAIEDAYNEAMNGVVPPNPDSQHLTFPGLSSYVKLFPHRVAAVARFIADGYGMMAHGVGSGKTITQIMVAMEMKRLGLVNKPLIVVHNATLGGFAREVMKAYPAARILVADEKSYETKNRKKFFGRLTTGDWDAVIMAQSQFDLLESDPSVMKAFLMDKIGDLQAAVNSAEVDGDRTSINTLNGMISALTAKMDMLTSKLKGRQDNSIYFENMGVDALFIDEAHAYKNVPIVTRMKRVKGVPSGSSQRALNLECKALSIQRKGGGRNVFGATGTPVVNTMAEAYVMLKMFAPNVLEMYRIKSFDDFASTFGVTESKVEFHWTGVWRNITRFRRFVNLQQLSTMIRAGFDVRMGNKELGLDVPEMVGGRAEQIILDQSDGVAAAVEWQRMLGEAYESLEDRKKREYNWIAITTMQMGVAAAVDPRLIDPSLPDDPNSKVNVAVQRIADYYQQEEGRLGTQLVMLDRFAPMNTSKLRAFLPPPWSGETRTEAGEVDMSDAEAEAAADAALGGQPTPEGEDAESSESQAKADDKAESDIYKTARFNLYRDMKAKLVAKGIPEDQIAIIHDYGTQKAREKLQDDINAGRVRVLMGSTPKLGVGVNIQKRLFALHMIDPPRDMTPAMREQRVGRIIRQGNNYAKGSKEAPGWDTPVHVIDYGTKDTMDVAIVQMMERKQTQILQVLSGSTVAREMEDPADEVLMDMKTMMANLAGDQRVLRRVELEGRVRELNLRRDGFMATLHARRRDVEGYRFNIASERRDIQKDVEMAKALDAAVSKEPMVLELNGTTFEKKDDAIKAIKQAIGRANKEAVAATQANRGKGQWVAVRLSINSIPMAIEVHAEVDREGNTVSTVYAGVLDPISTDRKSIYSRKISDAGWVFTALREAAQDRRNRIAQSERTIERGEAEIARLTPLLNEEFDQLDELHKAQAELEEINAQLVAEGNRNDPKARREAAAKRAAEAAEKARYAETAWDRPPAPSAAKMDAQDQLAMLPPVDENEYDAIDRQIDAEIDALPYAERPFGDLARTHMVNKLYAEKKRDYLIAHEQAVRRAIGRRMPVHSYAVTDYEIGKMPEGYAMDRRTKLWRYSPDGWQTGRLDFGGVRFSAAAPEGWGSIRAELGMMTAPEVEAAIAPLVAEFGPARVVARAVDSTSSVATQIRQAKSREPRLRIRGVWHRAMNMPELFADGLFNEAEAVATYLHEKVGHEGAEAILGKVATEWYRTAGADLRARFDRSREAVLNGTAGRREAAFVERVAKILVAYRAAHGETVSDELLGMEYVAHAAERNDWDRPWLERAKTWLRFLLRKILDALGLRHIEIDDADVSRLLARAADKLRREAGVDPDGTDRRPSLGNRPGTDSQALEDSARFSADMPTGEAGPGEDPLLKLARDFERLARRRSVDAARRGVQVGYLAGAKAGQEAGRQAGRAERDAELREALDRDFAAGRAADARTTLNEAEARAKRERAAKLMDQAESWERQAREDYERKLAEWEAEDAERAEEWRRVTELNDQARDWGFYGPESGHFEGDEFVPDDPIEAAREEARRQGVREGEQNAFERKAGIFAEGKRAGNVRAVEDTIAQSFRLAAQERGVKFWQWAVGAGEVLEQFAEGLDGRTFSEQEQVAKVALREVFGPERVDAIRRASGNVPAVEAMRYALKWLAKRSNRIYGKSYDRLLRYAKKHPLHPDFATDFKALVDGNPLGESEEFQGRDWRLNRDLFNEARALLTQSIERQAEIATARMENRALNNEAMVTELEKATKPLNPNQTEGNHDTPRNRGRVVDFATDKQASPQVRALAAFGNKSGVGYQVFHEQLRHGEEAALRLSRSIRTSFYDTLKAMGWDEKRIIEAKTKRVAQQFGGRPYEMTQAERIMLLWTLRDMDGRAKLVKNGFLLMRERGQPSRRVIGPPEELDLALLEFASNATADERRIVDGLIDRMNQLGQAANKTAVVLKGYEPFVSGSYAPLRTEMTDQAQNLELNAKRMYDIALENLGFTKERQTHSHPLLIGDAFDIFEDHTDAMGRLTHLAIPIRDAMSAMGDPVLGEELRKRLGTAFEQRTQRSLRKLAGLRDNKPPGLEGLNRVARNASAAILSLRPTSIIKNRLGGTMMAAARIACDDPALAMRFLSESARPVSLRTESGDADEAVLMSNGYLLDRWSKDLVRSFTATREDREASPTAFRLGWRRLQQMGLRPMANAEIRNAIAMLRSMRASGMTDAAALDYIERIVRETQNPSSALDESDLYLDLRENPQLSIMFPFTGQPVVMRNLIHASLLNWRNAATPEARTKARNGLVHVLVGTLANVALSLGLSALIYAMKHRDGSGDDKERDKRLLAQAASEVGDMVIPGFGSSVIDAFRAMTSGGSGYSPSMVFDVAENIIRGIKKMWNADEEAETITGAMSLFDGITTALGVPFTGGASQVSRMVLGPDMQGKRQKRRAILDRAVRETGGSPRDLAQAQRDAWNEVRAAGLMDAVGEDGTPRTIEAQKRAFDQAWRAAVERENQ